MVSEQLSVETYCLSLGNVYTFVPAFRSENSNTSRHLAKFWMIEPEMAFADLKPDMQLGQELTHFLIRYTAFIFFVLLLLLGSKLKNQIFSLNYDIKGVFNNQPCMRGGGVKIRMECRITWILAFAS